MLYIYLCKNLFNYYCLLFCSMSNLLSNMRQKHHLNIENSDPRVTKVTTRI